MTTVDSQRGTILASCVIVAYHRPHMVRRLVEQLAHPRLEVVVVNVEDDPAIRTITGAVVVPTRDNVGYARGVNIGVAHGGAPVVVFMNDDVEASAHTVLELARHVVESRSDVAIPLVENAHGHVELGNRPPLKLAPRMLLSRHQLPLAATSVDAAWAVLVAVRAEVLRAIPLPETYFMYWEEFDWFFRLREERVTVHVVPWARVRHVVGTLSLHPEKSRLLARNAVRCVRQTRGRWPALRAWPVVVAWQASLWVSSLIGTRPRNLGAHAAGVQAALGAWREI